MWLPRDVEPELVKDALEALVAKIPDMSQLVLNEVFSSIAARSGIYPYGKYDDLLLSLPDQLTVLRGYNEKYWGGAISEEQFSAVDISSDQNQTIGDIELLYVEFHDSKETLLNWAKALEFGVGVRNDIAAIEFPFDVALTTGHTRKYTTGIHRIHVCLFGGYGYNDCVLGECCHRTIRNSESFYSSGEAYYLAHGEALAIYAMNAAFTRALSRDFESWNSVVMGYIASKHYSSFPMLRLDTYQSKEYRCLSLVNTGEYLSEPYAIPLVR